MSDRVWTIGQALGWTVEFLTGKGVDSPRRSAEWLLSAATGLSRIELYVQHERPLSDRERSLLREGVRRRAEGEPLQYVTGEMPFRHLVIKVRPGVLIPRPETEVLVDVALDRLREGTGSNENTGPGAGDEVDEGSEVGRLGPVVDLCTGTGCVALSLAHEVPDLSVLATDISALAVDLASENAERLGLSERVTAIECDLFEALPRDLAGTIAGVVANPPYVPSNELPELPIEVAEFEPRVALDGGPDGLEVVRRIMREASEWLRRGGWLALEVHEHRAVDAAREMAEWYEGVEVIRDLTGRERVVAGRLRARSGAEQHTR